MAKKRKPVRNSKTVKSRGKINKDKVRINSRKRRRRPQKGFASWSIGKKIGSILGGTIVIAMTACIVLVASKLGKIEQTTLDTKKLNISEEVEEKLSGYTNVALFGVDSRDAELGQNTRSDTIMVASLNNETKEVRISSVYRDTLLQMSDGTYNKVNAAHSFGGPEEAVATLNKNLDLDITKYVTVNFNAMISIIDAVGGIEIDVQPEEVNYITGYACEIIEATGVDSEGVFEPGLQTLNGVQATAYARIRYTSGDDFRRAERQREVLEKILQKLQKANLNVLNKVIDSVFPQVSTNFTLPEILSYAKYAKKYTIAETTGFPFDKSTDTLAGIGSIVVPQTLSSNVIKLHEYFFGADGYVPSSTVSSISDGVAYRVATGAKGNGLEDKETDNFYENKNNSSSNNSSGNTEYQPESSTGNSNANGGQSGGTTTHPDAGGGNTEPETPEVILPDNGSGSTEGTETE
ncbi:LCP family protein [Lachnospiraceae bacterium LCP25S3_G4]